MSLTDTDQRRIGQARELADATDLEAIRKMTDSDIDTYAEAFGIARVRLGDLLAIIDRLADDDTEAEDDDDETYTCARCGASISIFIGQQERGWQHYRGEGTAASPIELYDAGHEAAITAEQCDPQRSTAS